MKKKWIILLSVIILILLISWITIFRKVGKYSILDAVPQDVVFTIDMPSMNNVHESLNKNKIWQSLISYPYFEEYHDNMHYMDSLGSVYPGFKKLILNRPAIISCHVLPSRKYDYLYISDLGKLNVIQLLDGLFNLFIKDMGMKIDKQQDMYQLIYDDLVFYFTIKDNLFIGSLEKELVNESLKACQSNVGKKSNYTNSGNITFNLYHHNLDKWIEILTETSKIVEEAPFFDITNLTLTLHSDNIKLDGETCINTENFSIINIINMVDGGESKIKNILGENIAGYISVCYKSFPELQKTLVENYKEYNTKEYENISKSLEKLNKLLRIDVMEVFTSWIGNEIAIIRPELMDVKIKDNMVVAIQANDIEFAKDQMAYLSEQIYLRTPVKEQKMEYSDHTIYYFRLKGFFDLLLGSLVNKFERPYYTFIGDYVVLSNSPAVLTQMIKEYVLENTLSENERYVKIMSGLGSNKNIYAYVNSQNTYEYLFQTLKREPRKTLELNKDAFLSFDAIGLSMKNQKDAFKTNMIAYYNNNAPEEFKLKEINKQLEKTLDNIEAGLYVPFIPEEVAISDANTYQYTTEEYLFSGNLKDGDPDGIWSIYKKNGKLFAQFGYEKNRLDGLGQLFYDNGEIFAEVVYAKGKIKQYKEYFPDGALKAEVPFNNGKRHGDVRFYYNTGQVYCEGKYRKGKPTKKWKYFKVTGEKLIE